MHILMIVGTLLWFVLTGLLWYAKPNDHVWLFGSLVLGAVYFAGFLLYVTRAR